MFTLDWLDGELAGHSHAPADVQRTLQALTCHSIARQLPVLADAQSRPELYVCGGGAHNAPLLAELVSLLPGWRIANTVELGIAPTGWRARRLPGWRSALFTVNPATCRLSPVPAARRYWVPFILPESGLPQGAP